MRLLLLLILAFGSYVPVANAVADKPNILIIWGDDGSLTLLRYNRWKMVFTEQRAHGFAVWEEPMVTLRVPKLFDLRGRPL